ncbi:MarR family transcriptional regulator [Corynebacterium hylobatis]|uniref:MarR family transcriptional regulator n=1 Tax=Corynebacterium hylobatis TaxID=1859290 RepID=A0A430HVS6_9CORY|nr:MarR family transcriptional regulator [Corynebacterium hylobatis]RSZ61695.1 MarR family transcriptional regulator [Corynebacterium hylobatis]
MNDTRWLQPEESATWLSLWSVTNWLPARLDEQLKATSGVGLTDYFVLAQVSMAPEQKISMTELAALSDMTASRLSHTVARLEKRGWVHRSPDPTDKRTNIAHLTEEGMDFLTSAAPGHVEAVRSLIFDALEPEESREFGRLLGKVLSRLDPPRLPRA